MAGEVGDKADVAVEFVGVVEEIDVVAAVVDEAVDAGEEFYLGAFSGL